MSALGEIFIKKETLETLLRGVNAKGITGIGITISINDQAKVFRSGEKETRQNISDVVGRSEQLCQCEDAPTKHFIKNWCDDCKKHIV